MKKKYLVILPLILCIAFIYANSQDGSYSHENNDVNQTKLSKSSELGIKVGIEAGAALNLFSVDMKWNPVIPNSPLQAIETGTGLSPFIGLIFDFGINDRLGAQLKTDYSGYNTNNVDKGYGDCVDNSEQLTLTEIETDNSVSGSFFSVSALLRYNITQYLMITAGPFVSMPIGDFEEETILTILNPDCFFIGSGQKYYYSKINKEKVNSFVGIEIGAAYLFKISESISLSPSIQFRYGLTQPFEDNHSSDIFRASSIGISKIEQSNSSIHSLRLGAIVWFDLSD